MATNDQLTNAGFALPSDDDYLGAGAAAIRKNANAAYEQVKASVAPFAQQLEALSKDTDEGNIQRINGTGSSISYTLLPGALTQAVIITQGPAGNASISHPGGITWHGGTAPTLDLSPGTVAYLIFLQIQPGAWLGFAVSGLDKTNELADALPELIAQVPENVLSNWVRGGTTYLGVYTRRTGTATTGITLEVSKKILGVINARHRNEPDLTAFMEPATEQDQADAGERASLTISGKTIVDVTASHMVQVTLTERVTSLSLGAIGSIYSQQEGNLTISQVGNYTNDFTGNHPTYNGSVEHRAGDTVRVLYHDGQQIAQVQRAGSKAWQTLYKKPVKRLPNDTKVRARLTVSAPSVIKNLAITGKEA